MKTVKLKPSVKEKDKKKTAAKKSRTICQSGAVPYLMEKEELRVMLVTSSSGDAWIFPKGNIAKGMDTLKSAAKEAYEEAGVVGECENNILGVIQIEKSPSDLAEVNIYPLKIEKILPEWQESGVRNRRMFRIAEAIGVMRGERSRKVLENLRDMLLERSEFELKRGNAELAAGYLKEASGNPGAGKRFKARMESIRKKLLPYDQKGS